MYRTLVVRKGKSLDYGEQRFVTRGGFDVGTGGAISWTIASMYPKQAIMRKQIFHSSLPLPSMETMIQCNMITPIGKTALENAFFQIFGRLDEARIRPRQMAAIVCEPLSSTLNSSEVFNCISQRFLINIKLAGRAEMEQYAHLAYVIGAGLSVRLASRTIVWTEIDDRVVLLRRKYADDTRDKAADDTKQTLGITSGKTDIWDTKHTPQNVHSTILSNYQGRKIVEAHAGDAAVQSVNPMSAKEILVAVDDLTNAFRQAMPAWVKEARRSSSVHDRLFCGASVNGGTINILSRSCSKTDIDLYTARSHLYSTYVGVTDAFLNRSYPTPHLVLPRLIIAHSLMNALDLRFLRYLPETNPSFGILASNELFPLCDAIDSGLHESQQKPVYLDRPWRSLSPNPHVSQHIQASSDQLLFRKPDRK
ncbi:cytochrome c oxidase subunit COX19 [Perkinsela sp. CCAP 1560/4]|nr:cytochrome c oxidase subunit COX19 [Perkinsela sp. CCAP 1560/4]|eukprot:KNH09633.1 cytochrome c oxidase subunit COX19 [Perkinsela sp. CCAP 1560/4]